MFGVHFYSEVLVRTSDPLVLDGDSELIATVVRVDHDWSVAIIDVVLRILQGGSNINSEVVDRVGY